MTDAQSDIIRHAQGRAERDWETSDFTPYPPSWWDQVTPMVETSGSLSEADRTLWLAAYTAAWKFREALWCHDKETRHGSI